MKEKRDCRIVQDLLPNYIDKLTSQESNVFVQEHLKECKECKKILENMKKDLETDIKENEKTKVNYIKKYNKKLKLLKIILLIIISVFVIITGRKVIIMSSLSNRADKYVNSENYHIESISYNGDELMKIDSYYKDGKSLIVLKSIKENSTNKISMYNNGKVTNTYYETGNNKTAKLNESDVGLRVHIVNYLDNNLFGHIFASLTANIKTINRNGKECYLINNYWSSEILKGTQDITYIEKETGLIIRQSDGITYKTSSGTQIEAVRDLKYEFGTVTDEIFIEPDISEYEIKK